MKNDVNRTDGRTGKDLYVSTTGDDRNRGTQDKPFASIARAQVEVRDVIRTTGHVDITVWLSGGEYCLDETLVLDPADGARPGQSIVYAALPGEKPILSGGCRITGWAVDDKGWTVTLPEVAKGKWDFVQIFVNGQRRSRPRLPREGYCYIDGDEPSSPNAVKGGHDRFVFKEGDLKSSWHNLSDVELLLFHEWSTSRVRLSELDDARRVATVVGGSTRHALKRGGRFLVNNVKDEQMPGEWYLDRKSGHLTYLPLPGETPENTVVIAPRLDRVLEIKGDVAAKHWVENVSFIGITFAHANWVLPPMGSSIPQAESDMPAAVHAAGARHCAFKQCAFTLMGGFALELGDGCQHNMIETCDVTDIGGGGVKIGPTRTDNQDVVASHNTVRDCLLAHLGRIHPAGVGVWVGFGHHIVVEHNDIYDLYYSGISMGWSWNYDETPNHDNAIRYNHIHDAMQFVLTDGAAIYTLGLQLNSVMSGNVIHDVEGVPWAVGIYLDQGSTGWLCENNLVYNVTTHDFNVNFGRDNIARNNIFGPILDTGAPLLRCGTIEDHRSMTIENNLIYFTVGDLVDSVWPMWPVKSCLLRNNLYWNAAGLPVRFRDRSWVHWRNHGHDEGSIIADPLFADPENGDYRLRPGSPASRIGFKPFDDSKAGRLTAGGTPHELFPRAYPADSWNPPHNFELPD